MAKLDTLKTHKKGVQAFEWNSDIKPNKLKGAKLRSFIRKERQQGKSIIRNELKLKGK